MNKNKDIKKLEINVRKDKYCKMTDEERQKIKEYQKEFRKNMTDEQKQRYKENKRNKKELNNGKIIITIIKDNDHFNDVIEL